MGWRVGEELACGGGGLGPYGMAKLFLMPTLGVGLY